MRTAPRKTSRTAGLAPWLIGGAAALAGLAAYHALQGRRAERENPPEGRFVTVDGVRLHYVARGRAGPAVVILHGNGATVADMLSSPLVDRLAERYRVILFDRPGYGHSARPRSRLWTPQAQAALLAKAIAALGLERPLVMGHSWGALVAAALGVAHPEAARGLVLLSGYYFPTGRSDVVLFSPPAIPVLGDAIRYTLSPLLARALAPLLTARIFEPQVPTERFNALYPYDLAVRPWQLRASAAETGMMVPAAAMLKGRYAGIDLPVAILAGTEDRIVTTERQSARLHGTIPGSTLTVLPGLGHMIHHFAPGAIAEAVEALMGSGPAGDKRRREGEPRRQPQPA